MTAPTLVRPAWHKAPERFETLGPEVAGICELAGFAPDPEQQLALDDIFGLSRAGTPVADEAAIVAPRQNIKTGLFKQCALGWLFVTDERLIIWSAHEFSTAQEAHRDLSELIEGSDPLRKRVKKITNGNGDEGIELTTGQRVKFKARTKTGGRGLTGDKVVLDEAFALLPKHMGSLVPTMAARPHGQIVYGSSAGLVESEVLRSIRDRGRKGGDPGLVYVEFADDLPGDCELGRKCTHATTEPGCRLDDHARWARANSQLGRRIQMKALERERRSLPPEEFGRERLGWWDEPDTHLAAISPEKWTDLRDPDAARGTAPVFAVATAPDRSWSAIATAWRRPDGLAQVMIGDDYRPDTAWVAPRIAELRSRWGGRVVVDTASRSLLAVAEEPSEADQAKAHNTLSDAVVAGTVRHGNEAALNTAVRGSRWKQGAKTRELQRDSPVDVSPLAAAALAVHALSTTPPSSYEDRGLLSF